MLPFEATRWNAIATLWGVLGAGLIVALVLQERGEAIQVDAWLKAEADQVLPFVNHVFMLARILTFPYGVPVEVVNALLSERGAARAAVYERGRVAISNLTSRADGDELIARALRPESINHLEFRMRELDMLHKANAPLLARLTRLHGLLRRLIEAGVLLAGNLRSLDMPAEVRLIMMGSVAQTALDLCELCQQLEDRATRP